MELAKLGHKELRRLEWPTFVRLRWLVVDHLPMLMRHDLRNMWEKPSLPKHCPKEVPPLRGDFNAYVVFNTISCSIWTNQLVFLVACRYPAFARHSLVHQLRLGYMLGNLRRYSPGWMDGCCSADAIRPRSNNSRQHILIILGIKTLESSHGNDLDSEAANLHTIYKNVRIISYFVAKPHPCGISSVFRCHYPCSRPPTKHNKALFLACRSCSRTG